MSQKWQKVDVSLSEPTTTCADTNHYDGDGEMDAERDLEGTEEDHPGIFLSLEVIQDYSVLKSTVAERDDEAQIEESATDKEPTTYQAKAKRTRRRKRKERPNISVDQATQAATTTEAPDDTTTSTVIQQSWMNATHGVLLHSGLCKRLTAFPFPTSIQAAVLPPAMLGRSNIMGAAPTGSGKTLAFLLPILDMLWQNCCSDDHQDSGVQALILTPTRELAKQIYQQAVELSNKRTWVGCFTGGLALVKQERVLDQKPPIVVGTPGRLWELINSGDYKHVKQLECLKFLVLDEADRMMATAGSFPELHKILDVVERRQGKEINRKTFLFSATLTLLGKNAESIMAKARATGPTKVVDLSQKSPHTAIAKRAKHQQNTQFQLPPGLRLLEIKCTQRHKDSHLYAYLMLQQQSALVFCNSISAVRRVGQTLRTLGWSVRILHAHMPQVSQSC